MTFFIQCGTFIIVASWFLTSKATSPCDFSWIVGSDKGQFNKRFHTSVDTVPRQNWIARTNFNLIT